MGVPNDAKYIFPIFVIEEIVIYTNKYIQRLRAYCTRERDAADTKWKKIKGLIGLLIWAGIIWS